ncbi:hypothetical protein CDAR_97461 [Caerostris darwini]|uniref:Uncharacterized protein n=1 Tax=Caerostris darwini TaxID=1538125 RepID=A0AAV4PRU6_9ARAC|nr:hypothetical protein CDAR_97461 [Caerostris darwini]
MYGVNQNARKKNETSFLWSGNIRSSLKTSFVVPPGRGGIDCEGGCAVSALKVVFDDLATPCLLSSEGKGKEINGVKVLLPLLGEGIERCP